MKPSQAKNLYEILGLEKNASPKEIEIAFRKQALIWHPDKNIDDSEGSDAEFKILMNAYCILSDPEKKRDYDKSYFKRIVSPNYGRYRDERLSLYRARQRASINRLLKKNQRSDKFFKKTSRLALFTMIAAAGWFFYCIYQATEIDGNESSLGPFMLCLPLFLFNGAMICHALAKKEIADNRKKSRSLAVKLYSLVEEQ
jgi:curved DNA-binding protein CbpA